MAYADLLQQYSAYNGIKVFNAATGSNNAGTGGNVLGGRSQSSQTGGSLLSSSSNSSVFLDMFA